MNDTEMIKGQMQNCIERYMDTLQYQQRVLNQLHLKMDKPQSKEELGRIMSRLQEALALSEDAEGQLQKTL